MIGKHQIVIGADQLTTGMASSEFATDGALAPSSYGINPFVTPGILRQTALEVDASTNVVGNIIASCESGGTATAYDRMFVDDAANYYSLSGGTITKQKTGTATTHYKTGKTDMLPFGNQIYVSLDNDVAQWNGGATLTENWGTTTAGWTFNSSNYWHPMIVFERLLWVADGANMNSFDGGSAFTSTAILNSNESIVALGIDPATGFMLISFQTNGLGNYNNTVQPKYYVGLYDGYSTKLRRKIEVDAMVTAFYAVGGTVYVGYGQRLGQWNGNGITFLRNLANVTNAAADLPYKHHFTHNSNVLYVADGLNILAFGEVVGGTLKKFFYTWKNTVNSNKIGCLSNIGANKLGVAFASSKLYTIDMSSTATTTGAVVNLSNIYFPRPIQLRRIRFITTGVTGVQTVAIAMAVTDENARSSFVSNASRFWAIPAATTRYTFDVDFGGATLQGLALSFSMNGANFGIIKIIMYYDAAE